MKVYFPSYYNKFKCIAEKCRHSCCVGWEIEIDGDTLDKYKDENKSDILGHILDGEIVLCDDGRCPFLDEAGLCKIISSLGEEYTSVICREHPRFYHRIGERIEGGIGASCEEAARIILTSDDYDSLICLNKEKVDAPDETDMDTLGAREEIYGILKDRETPYSARLDKIRKKYSLPKELHTADEWQQIFSELELLDPSHKELISVGRASDECYSVYSERFLAYLIFRHASVAENYDNLRARIAFCLLLTEMLDSFVSRGVRSEVQIVEAARIISEEIEYSVDNCSSIILDIVSII